MIKPICYKCNSEIQEFGAVLISPPIVESREDFGKLCHKVYKIHLCTTCWDEMIAWVHK